MGRGDEMLGVLAHSEWSRVPESRLSPCISGGTGHCTTPTGRHACYVYRSFHITHASRRDKFCGNRWTNARTPLGVDTVLEHSVYRPLFSFLAGVATRVLGIPLSSYTPREKGGEERRGVNECRRETISSARPTMITDKVWGMQLRAGCQGLFSLKEDPQSLLFSCVCDNGLGNLMRSICVVLIKFVAEFGFVLLEIVYAIVDRLFL